MKRIINIFLCAGAIALTAISCQKSIDDERPVTPPEKGDGHIEIRIGAALGDYTPVGATKAELINTVRASWNGGETVYVFDGTECLGSLKASLYGEDHGYALLSTDDAHTVDKPADGTSVLTLVYSPALKGKPEITDGALTVSLAKQDGSETPFVTYATLDYDGSESIVIENTVLPFKFATSVVQFNCTCDNLITGKPFRAAVLSNVNTVCKLTFSADKAPAVSGTKIGQIFKNGDDNTKVYDNGSVVFQIDIPILEASSYARTLIINQYFEGGSKPYRNVNNAFPKSELPMGTSFNIACQMKNIPEAPNGAINGVFTVNEDGKQVYFSGCNLYYYNKLWYCHGLDQWVNKETNGDVGDNYKNKTGQMLFGWGDITPLRTDTDDDKYKWPTDGSDPWGSKADDSADVYPKGTWRTLSIDEWNCLIGWNNPIREGKYKEDVQIRTSEYGKVTGLVIAPDDFPEEIKSDYGENEFVTKYGKEYGLVFLPLGGRRYGTTVGNVGSGISGGGYYWSSTTKENYTSHAWVMSFSEATVWQWQSEPKHTGASVRLVSDVKY